MDEAQPQARHPVVGAACAIAAVAIWAGFLVMMRLGVTTTLSAPDLTALRLAVAGPLLLPVVLRRGLAVDRLGWPGFAAVVMGAGAPYPLLVGTGLSFAPVAHASALTHGILPLVVAGFAALVLQERVSSIRKAGLVLVFLGGLVIAGLGLWSFDRRESIGHLLFLAATCCWASCTVAIRRARIDGLHAPAIAAVVSALLYLPLYFIFIEHGLFEVRVADLLAQAFYQGVLTAALSLGLYARAVNLLGASNAAAFIALAPVLAALMAIPVLGEWPSRGDWAAILIIAAGVYLASGAPLPRRRLTEREGKNSTLDSERGCAAFCHRSKTHRPSQGDARGT